MNEDNELGLTFVVRTSYLNKQLVHSVNTHVLRTFHLWCQVGTFSQKKDQIHVHVPI